MERTSSHWCLYEARGLRARERASAEGMNCESLRDGFAMFGLFAGLGVGVFFVMVAPAVAAYWEAKAEALKLTASKPLPATSDRTVIPPKAE